MKDGECGDPSSSYLLPGPEGSLDRLSAVSEGVEVASQS